MVQSSVTSVTIQMSFMSKLLILNCLVQTRIQLCVLSGPLSPICENILYYLVMKRSHQIFEPASRKCHLVLGFLFFTVASRGAPGTTIALRTIIGIKNCGLPCIFMQSIATRRCRRFPHGLGHVRRTS
eukprot:1103329-Karenia_brevis.AAC.1